MSEQWECGPHANAWNGHDARCRRVPARRPATVDTEQALRAHQALDCWCGARHSLYDGDGYQPCSAECNGCPTCDPGLRPATGDRLTAAEAARDEAVTEATAECPACGADSRFYCLYDAPAGTPLAQYRAAVEKVRVLIDEWDSVGYSHADDLRAALADLPTEGEATQ